MRLIEIKLVIEAHEQSTAITDALNEVLFALEQEGVVETWSWSPTP